VTSARVASVIRGTWGERGRATLAVIAIAVGVAGFFAVLATYAILQRELRVGYLATNPASAILVTRDIDQALLTAVIARDDVEDAERRRLLRGRIRSDGGPWHRLALFVLTDLEQPRINTVTRERGTTPIQAGDLLIERDAFQVAGVQVGDQVDIEVETGNVHSLRVTGGIHDVGQAQARMENMVYGYITPPTLPLLGQSAALDRLHVLVSGDRFDASRVRRVADDVRAWLEASGHPVSRVIVPTPGQHPHAAIMGLLLLSISAFGLVILGISTVIVFTVMLSTMVRQRRQIGVMKATGGTRGQIAAIYLARAGLLGVAALAIGVPAGLGGSRALTDYLAVLLNFDITSYAIPLWVYLLVALVGIASPLLAAAYPVARGTAVTVLQALSEAPADALRGVPLVRAALARLTSFGPQTDSGGAGLLRPVAAKFASLAPKGATASLLITNTIRRPGRAALIVLTMTLAGASFVTALNVREAMMAAIDALFGAGTFGRADRYAFDQHMLRIYVFLVAAAGVLSVVGSLGMMTVTSLNVLDRRREFGVLRTLGAPPLTIVALVVSEAAILAILSWLLALLAAWPLSALLGRFLTLILFRRGLGVTFSLSGVAAWLVIVSAVSIASSIFPATNAARRSIREAISYE
jgi:putative ABC transport system permease protein